MRTRYIALTMAAMLAVTACSNIMRSRDTANPYVSGETLAVQVCSNCHGTTGNSVSPNFPNLAAQQAAYITAQLDSFRKKRRSDPAGFEYMWGISRSLTDKQIEELSIYFSRQVLTNDAMEGTSGQAAAGKAIFEGGVPANGVPPCNSCHGPQGMGNQTFPRIAGQHMDYLKKQLAVFQRTNERSEGVVMQTVAHQLTRRNIDDVTAYVQTLRAP
ncbi:MAG: cytochrome c4 [Proteobacteria bacterium]|nr:cytochrome c4 [Pseudomonadota bacterium]